MTNLNDAGDKRNALRDHMEKKGMIYYDEEIEREMVLAPVNVVLDAVEIIYGGFKTDW